MTKPPVVNRESVRGWMVQHGVKQKRLAQQLEVTPEYLSKVLTGQRTPSLDLLARLGDITGQPWWSFVLPPDMEVVSRSEVDAMRGLRALLRREL